MITIMNPAALAAQTAAVPENPPGAGFTLHRSPAIQPVVLGAVGGNGFDDREVRMMPGVAEVVQVKDEFQLSGKKFREKTVVSVGDLKIGGNEVIIMAGPCAVESEFQLQQVAPVVKAAGGKVLR